MSAARLLQETRRCHEIDQRSLARRAGTSQAQISRIERGETSPSIHTLARLMAAMGERLELVAAPPPRGNQTTESLHAGHAESTPGTRVADAAELSLALTSIAAGTRRR